MRYCSGFGHSDCFKTDKQELTALLEDLILNHDVENFLLSNYGNFDSVFSSCVKGLKKTYPTIKLILVKPYYTKELLKSKGYYTTSYDEVLIPEISAKAHFKSAITIRNRWIIEKSDFIVSNVYKGYGGAFEAVNYAKKINKNILYLSNHF